MNDDIFYQSFGLINALVAAVTAAQSWRHKGRWEQVLSKLALGIFFLTTIGLTLVFTVKVVILGLITPIYVGILTAIICAWIALGLEFFAGIEIACFLGSLLCFLILLTQSIHDLVFLNTDPKRVFDFFVSLHIAGATMGQFFALGAGFFAALFLWKQRVLKEKTSLTLSPTHAPALDSTEKMFVASAWIGFLFLTIALVSGGIVFYKEILLNRKMISKIIWAIAVWCWYLNLLISYLVFLLPIRRIAQMALIGLAMLVFAFFGLIFWTPTEGGF